MATRLYGANPGYSLEQITEAVGPAATAHSVELNVDLSNAIISDNGATRTMSREEVLICLDLFKQYIVRSYWPPA